MVSMIYSLNFISLSKSKQIINEIKGHSDHWSKIGMKMLIAYRHWHWEMNKIEIDIIQLKLFPNKARPVLTYDMWKVAANVESESCATLTHCPNLWNSFIQNWDFFNWSETGDHRAKILCPIFSFPLSNLLMSSLIHIWGLLVNLWDNERT